MADLKVRPPALAAALTLACVVVSARTSPPPHPLGYVAYRATTPILVDGKLDDAAWTQVPWSADFVDIEGDVRPKPTWPTHVKMLWDDQFLYVGAELREPNVWATQTQHDSVIFHENDFEVFVDPDADNRNYYEFEINALGTYWDLMLPIPYRDGGHAVDSWEIPGLKSAVHVDGTINDSRDADRMWSVELAFPWSVLKEHTARPAPPHDGDQWRINFSRVEWDLDRAGTGYKKIENRKEHNWVWSPQGAIDMHRPEMWGYVQFSSAKPGTATFTPDASWPARAFLYEAYYAQRAFKDAHGHYATSLAELGSLPSDARLAAPSLVSKGDVGYAISVILTLPDRRKMQWQVDQGSAIRAEILGK